MVQVNELGQARRTPGSGITDRRNPAWPAPRVISSPHLGVVGLNAFREDSLVRRKAIAK